MIQKLTHFIQDEIWRIRIRAIPGIRGVLLRTLRIILISAREFNSDKCSLRASALTFFSLLSIVPVFAMAFGIAKGFGMDKMLKTKLLENMEGQQEAMTRVIDFSENMLQNTRGGVIAGIGLVFLFWTVIKVLGNIEQSFNGIWGVKKERSWGRKFTDYLSLMMIAPIIFLVGSSVTIFIVSQVQILTEKMAFLGFLAPVILTSLKVLPYMVFWGLLTYLYIFMPNTKVNFKSALLGGVVAGTVYQAVQWAYIHFQIGVANAGAIYGSFAALPLFLIWLQLSWTIVLYGAELAFSHQNEDRFEFEPDCLKASPHLRKTVALRITQICVQRFTSGLAPLAAEQIADELDMPIRLTRDILFQLCEAGILIIVQGESERDRRYQPARDIAEMNIHFVLDRLDKTGCEDIPMAPTPELAQLRSSLTAFEELIRRSPANLPLKSTPESSAAKLQGIRP